MGGVAMCRMDLPGPIDAASVTAENYGELLAALSAMPARLDAVIAAVPGTPWRTPQGTGALSLLWHPRHLRHARRATHLPPPPPHAGPLPGRRPPRLRPVSLHQSGAAGGCARRARGMCRGRGRGFLITVEGDPAQANAAALDTAEATRTWLFDRLVACPVQGLTS